MNNCQATPQYPHGWDFIMNWMSDRVWQKNVMTHGEGSSEDVEGGEEHVDAANAGFTNATTLETIADEISFKYVDEMQLDVSHLKDKLVVLPLCDEGSEGLEKIYTDI